MNTTREKTGVMDAILIFVTGLLIIGFMYFVVVPAFTAWPAGPSSRMFCPNSRSRRTITWPRTRRA